MRAVKTPVPRDQAKTLMQHTDVALIGAGPIGLEVAAELKRTGTDYLHFEKKQIGSTIQWFPNGMTFFSSNDRIAIAGIPVQTTAQGKCSKEIYLAYLRTVVQTLGLEVRTYEEVVALEGSERGFLLRTRSAEGETEVHAQRVVLATGDMARPRRLGIEGEDLPHVSHYFRDPHPYFRTRLLIVGGKNSAVEAALRCWHVGAHRVTLSYRREAFDGSHVKYWLLPELEGRIARGEIDVHYQTVPVRITQTHVELRESREGGNTQRVRADHVLLLTGHVADMSLFEHVGAELSEENQTPMFDSATMETTVKGLYVAGTATAGTQPSFALFIENCHVHARRISRALRGLSPPEEAAPTFGLPES